MFDDAIGQERAIRKSPADAMPMPVGGVFGRLTVLGEAARVFVCGKPVRRALVRCECGRELSVDFAAIRKGHTRSCGCWRANMPIKGYRVARGDRHKRLHVARAEAALGRPLPKGAVVHHADGSKRDDAPLVICQDHAYHMLLHARMRLVGAGVDPDTHRICCHCQAAKPLADFGIRRDGRFGGRANQCKACRHGWKRQAA